jgi:hypothetical protein
MQEVKEWEKLLRLQAHFSKGSDFGQFATQENNRSAVLANFFLPVGTVEVLSTY